MCKSHIHIVNQALNVWGMAKTIRMYKKIR